MSSEHGDDGDVEDASPPPDFTSQALARLQVHADDFSLHVKGFLAAADVDSREMLDDDLHRMRNTLVLLEKGASVYVTEELLALLAADRRDEVRDQNEFARVLLLAAQQLSAHVELIQRDDSLESALPLLSLVNDSRACRGESLLSESLVLAAGIELPSPRNVDDEVSGQNGSDVWLAQREEWKLFAARAHASLAQRLLGWFRQPEADAVPEESLSRVIEEFENLAQFCRQREFLQILHPMFMSAVLVLRSISRAELSDGPALRSLYAQLERSVHRSSSVESPDDLLPADLLRNLLYYVAQIESAEPEVMEISRRFRLDRVRQARKIADAQVTPMIGVGYHLARAIRGSITAETRSLREWLDQSESARSELPKLVRLRVRLAQLEPVLTLMGVPEALECLRQINADLRTLDKVRSSSADQAGKSRILATLHDSLGRNLLLLDALLEQNARSNVRPATQPEDSRALPAEAVYVDMATDACLREARETLQQVADSLDDLLPRGGLSTGRCHVATLQLHLVDQVLQVLPLPEVSPLLRGLSDVLARLQLRSRQLARPIDEKWLGDVHVEISRLLVAVDYYLGCVLLPQASASQLLVDAEDALLRARALLDNKVPGDTSPTSSASVEQHASRLLSRMDALGQALSAYRKQPSTESLNLIGATLDRFRRQTVEGSSEPIRRLAVAASAWFENRCSSRQSLSGSQLAQLEEIHAVIPQLVDQWVSGSDDVRGYEDLLQRLQVPANPDHTARAAREPLRHTAETAAGSLPSLEPGETDFPPVSEAELQCAEDPDLNAEEDFIADIRDRSGSGSLDNTLQHVIHHECLVHLEALEESIRSALQPSADISQRLPTEKMLRALHMLAGSALAVDAPEVVDIVQPLQRAALARQRGETSFDASETRYIGELLGSLRARLESLMTGEPLNGDMTLAEARLPQFLADIIPGTAAVDSGLGLASHVSSLDEVFLEEAAELMVKLDNIVSGRTLGKDEVGAALLLLHTLKGSARMAGRVSVAESAHEVESDIQSLDDEPSQAEALRSGLTRLRKLLDTTTAHLRSSVDSAATGARKADSSSLILPDAVFDSLVDLATDVTVNQARLGDRLAQLRDAFHDIENTADRWRTLPGTLPPGRIEAVDEIMADLEASRLVMREALSQLERQQQQASRAASGLQQNLVRTRLVRLDEMRDRLTQTLRDAVGTIGNNASLEFRGGEVTLDRSLFRSLQAPLEHLLRNAIAHGIESRDERILAGKPATGLITVSAVLDGTDLVLQLSDDGRGIDLQALNRALLARGESPLASGDDMQGTLFRSGISSVESPTALAGHGLGLPAVQSAVEQLGGRVHLTSEQGKGTGITLRIPQRLAVSQVILVEYDAALFALPVASVESVRMSSRSDDAETVRSLSLGSLLQQATPAGTAGQRRSAASVQVNAAGQRLALEVDQVIGYRELVTQALGPQLAGLRRFAGGSVLANGRPVLIIDVSSAIQALSGDQRKSSRVARESLRPVALVVDDSLTMRTAAERVLQQCGLVVRKCRDGVEALDSMASGLPNIVVLDIEMPRLDGLGFLRRSRELYGDSCPPVIVVSSTFSDDQREHLERLGVSHYLTKPYTAANLQAAVEAAGLRLPDITIA